MSIKEKIEHEYRCFFLDMMSTSKENIFAHSGEIELKKLAKKKLLVLTSHVKEADESALFLQTNLLESVYRFLTDRLELPQNNPGSEELDGLIKEWYRSIIRTGESEAVPEEIRA